MNYKKYFLLSMLIFTGMSVIAEENPTETLEQSVEEKIKARLKKEEEKLEAKQKRSEEKSKAIREKIKEDAQKRNTYIQEMQQKEQLPEGLALKRFDEGSLITALFYVVTGDDPKALTNNFAEQETTSKKYLNAKFEQEFGKQWSSAFAYYINTYYPSKCFDKKNKLIAKYDKSEEITELKERYNKEEFPKAKTIFDKISNEIKERVEECNRDTDSINAARPEGKAKRCKAVCGECSKNEYLDEEKYFVEKLIKEYRNAGIPILKEEAQSLFTCLSDNNKLEKAIKEKYALCGEKQEEDQE